MTLSVEHLDRRCDTLEQALLAIEQHPESTDGVMTSAEVERWLAYRANRNCTTHDDGAGFANDTLQLSPAYLHDVRNLALALQKVFDASA